MTEKLSMLSSGSNNSQKNFVRKESILALGTVRQPLTLATSRNPSSAFRPRNRVFSLGNLEERQDSNEDYSKQYLRSLYPNL